MRRIVISLSDVMHAELAEVSARAHEPMVTPETWAAEAVESALATRRLPSIKPGRLGARVSAAVEHDYEPEGYRVRLDGLQDTQVMD